MHKIYWFSGTGNTLYVAREFAKSFPDAQLLSIASLDRAEDVVLGSEMTGIFFPAYCMGIPHIMEQFLARVVPQENGNGGKYIYAVCTSGINPGGALPMIEDTLAEKKINLNACFHIRMPSNYIPLSNPPDEKQQAALFAKADRAIRIAVVAVKKRRKTRPLRVFPIDTFMKFVSKRAVATLDGCVAHGSSQGRAAHDVYFQTHPAAKCCHNAIEPLWTGSDVGQIIHYILSNV